MFFSEKYVNTLKISPLSIEKYGYDFIKLYKLLSIIYFLSSQQRAFHVYESQYTYEKENVFPKSNSGFCSPVYFERVLRREEHLGLGMHIHLFSVYYGVGCV